jgi:hypothetical protein
MMDRNRSGGRGDYAMRDEDDIAPSLRRHDPDQVLGVEASSLLSADSSAPPAKSLSKMVFWPNIGGGGSFQSSKYKSIPPVKNRSTVLTLNQNPILKRALFITCSLLAAVPQSIAVAISWRRLRNVPCYHPLPGVVNPALPFDSGLVMVAVQFRLGCSSPAAPDKGRRAGRN